MKTSTQNKAAKKKISGTKFPSHISDALNATSVQLMMCAAYIEGMDYYKRTKRRKALADKIYGISYEFMFMADGLPSELFDTDCLTKD
jgi:hypothetical protein